MHRITAHGLREHLEERVLAGNTDYALAKIMYDNDEDAGGKCGILKEDDLGFYLSVLRRKSNVKGSYARRTTEVYRIKDGGCIRIDGRTYETDLSESVA